MNFEAYKKIMKIMKLTSGETLSTTDGMVWMDYTELDNIIDFSIKLIHLTAQVDAMLSMAKRKSGKAIDDGDSWEISDDVFQEVQKSFEYLNKESPPAP